MIILSSTRTLMLMLGVGVLFALGMGILFPISHSSQVQEYVASSAPKKVGIIQYIAVMEDAATGFKDQMKALGYVEGKNIVYELQLAGGDKEKVNSIAKDF